MLYYKAFLSFEMSLPWRIYIEQILLWTNLFFHSKKIFYANFLKEHS